MRRIVVLIALTLLLSACGGYDATPLPGEESADGPGSSAPPAAAPTCNNDPAVATRSYAPGGSVASLSQDVSVRAIRSRGRLIAGVSADSYLLGSRNPISGQLEGFDIDMVKQVAKAIFGSDDPKFYTLRVITASDRIPVLMKDEVDMVVRNMTINCTRWRDIAFSTEYYRSGQKILVRSDLSDTGVTDVSDLADRTVCAPTGTTSLDNIESKQPSAQVITAANHTGCLVKFQRGEVEAITGDDTVLAGLSAQDPYAVVPTPQQAFTTEPYGIGVRAEEVGLVRFINAVLQEMRADGSWEASYRTWLQPYLGPSPGQPQPRYGR